MAQSSKSKTRQEIAAEYGISRWTLARWLRNAGIVLQHQGLVTPAEQDVIYKQFGPPRFKKQG